MSDAPNEPVRLDLSTTVELTPAGHLDLDEEWVTWLAEQAECPSNVEGIDPGISYADDGTAVA